MMEKVEAAIQEYQTLHNFYLEIYKNYTRSLAVIIFFVGAVFALFIKEYKSLFDLLTVFQSNDLFSKNPVIMNMLLCVLIFTINTWVAGWAYLHSELWSYRFYLILSEKFIRNEIGAKDSEKLYSFYSSGLFEMYNSKLFNKTRITSCHILSFCVSLSFIPVYFLIIFIILYLNQYNIISIVIISTSIFALIATFVAFLCIIKKQQNELSYVNCNIDYFTVRGKPNKALVDADKSRC